MNDYQVGPGWWRASDGRWYPPHLHPQAAPTGAGVSPEGWWQASDGRWYPPHLHPDALQRGPAVPSQEGAPDGAAASAGLQPGWDVASPGGFRTPPREAAGWDESWHAAGPATGAATGPPDVLAPSSPSPARRRRRRGPFAAIGAIVVVGALLTVFLVPLTGRASSGRPSTKAATASTEAPGAQARTIAVPGAPSMLTDRRASSVVASIWPVFVEAAAVRSRKALDLVASPDVAKVVESHWVCRCGTWPLAYSSLEVTAPPEESYPLSFLAEIDQPGDTHGASVQIVVFGKRSVHAPWLITDMTGYGGLAHQLHEAAALSARATSLVPGTQSFVELADLFASLRESGKAPAGNLWDDTVRGNSNMEPTAQELLDDDRYLNDRASRLHASASFSVSGYSAVFLRGSEDVQCATILGRVVVRPKPGHLITRRDRFVGLKAGTYSSVTEHEALDVCLMRPSFAVVDVLSIAGGIYSSVASRAR